MHHRKRKPEFVSGFKINGGLQIFEIKQLADKEAGYKRQCLESIKQYRQWCKNHEGETDTIELLYGNLEGIMLRRRAEDMIRCYWIIRQDFRKAFREYLAKNCCYPPAFLAERAA